MIKPGTRVKFTAPWGEYPIPTVKEGATGTYVKQFLMMNEMEEVYLCIKLDEPDPYFDDWNGEAHVSANDAMMFLEIIS